jgi:hypothetical protein
MILLSHVFIDGLLALQTTFIIEIRSGYSPPMHLLVSITFLVF